MPFPFTYQGRIVFPLLGDPDTVIDQFYEEASSKLNRRGLVSIDSQLTAYEEGGKLVVAYTLRFKQILSIISSLILGGLLLYFLTWDLFQPSTMLRPDGSSHNTNQPSMSTLLTVMGIAWLWLFGGMYLMVVLRYRLLLQDSWKDLRLGAEAEKSAE